MCIETNVELNLVRVLRGDIDSQHLEINVHGSAHHVEADLLVDSYGHAVISAVNDTFGLKAIARERLAKALHRKLSPLLGPMEPGTITWVRWVEPDLTEWLQEHLEKSHASSVISALAAHSTVRIPRFDKGFTESLME